MNEDRPRVTLHEPVKYEITVSGRLEPGWPDWTGATTKIAVTNDTGPSVSIITGTFDQAALHGILSRVYSLGFPLVSVNCVDDSIVAVPKA
jgi:hypothetical protein